MHVGFGLCARAEDRQHARVVPGEGCRGDSARARGADSRDLVRIGNAECSAGVPIKEQDTATMRRPARPLWVVEDAQDLGAEAGVAGGDARHQREQLAGFEGGDAAEGLLPSFG